MATKLIPATDIDIQTHSDRPHTNTHQQSFGTLSLIGDSMVRTKFPKQLTENKRVLRARAKLARAEHAEAEKVREVRELLRSAGAGIAKIEETKPKKGSNQGWNFRTMPRMKTTMTMLDTSAITARVEQNKDVHIAYLVLSYPRLMITDAASVHENIERFLRGARKIVGDELADIWTIEFKKSKQAHVNFLAALSDSEAYELRKLWARIAGWSGDYKLKDAAYLSMSTSYEERTKGAKALAENVMKYLSAFGDSPSALRKAHQFWTPPEWLETGTGAMWGYSRNIKQAAEVQFEITNIKQRKAVDTYLRKSLGIKAKLVRWANDETGEVSELYDRSAFSQDRSHGSSWGCFITPQMVADIRYIISSLA
ncbi:hypothetical protein ABC337_13900 [Arthrobacter sp. 1P04PC]|uniref:hypothetical protein n=1 Tax=unclassified Arthrobacter TaxID=235627 RepID=UPI0039A2D687